MVVSCCSLSGQTTITVHSCSLLSLRIENTNVCPNCINSGPTNQITMQWCQLQQSLSSTQPPRATHLSSKIPKCTGHAVHLFWDFLTWLFLFQIVFWCCGVHVAAAELKYCYARDVIMGWSAIEHCRQMSLESRLLKTSKPVWQCSRSSR